MPEKTKLFYNDFGEQHPEKRKAILQVIENIKEYETTHKEELKVKTLLDGIGLQSHYDLNITEQQIDDIYNDFSATSKEIQVTEMDVTPGYDENGHHLSYNSKNTKKYSKIWNKVFNCAKKCGVQAFTCWGISDSLSWYKNTGCTMVSENGSIKRFAQKIVKNNQYKYKLNVKQKMALFLQKNNLFMNTSLVNRFVHCQLDVLPKGNENTENNKNDKINNSSAEESFWNELQKGINQEYPQIQITPDYDKSIDMKTQTPRDIDEI